MTPCHSSPSPPWASASAYYGSGLSSLESLDLSDNNIQDLGSQALADKLGGCCSAPSSTALSSFAFSQPPTGAQEPPGSGSSLAPARGCGLGRASGTGETSGVGVAGAGGSAGANGRQVGSSYGNGAGARVCPALQELDLQRNPRIGDQGHRALERLAAVRPLSVTLSFQFNFPGDSA